MLNKDETATLWGLTKEELKYVEEILVPKLNFAPHYKTWEHKVEAACRLFRVSRHQNMEPGSIFNI